MFTNIVVYNLIKCAVFTSIVSKFEVCVDNQFTQRHRDVANRGCTRCTRRRRGHTHAATGCPGSCFPLTDPHDRRGCSLGCSILRGRLLLRRLLRRLLLRRLLLRWLPRSNPILSHPFTRRLRIPFPRTSLRSDLCPSPCSCLVSRACLSL